MAKYKMMKVDQEIFYPGLMSFKKKNGIKNTQEATKFLWKAVMGNGNKKKKIIKIKREIEF